MSLSNEAIQPPEWVRRRDGSQVPFDADRICQSLFAASEALGDANAFLAYVSNEIGRAGGSRGTSPFG